MGLMSSFPLLLITSPYSSLSIIATLDEEEDEFDDQEIISNAVQDSSLDQLEQNVSLMKHTVDTV